MAKSEQKRPYTSPYKRLAAPPGLQLQDRDRRVLLALHKYDFLNAVQIEALAFQTLTKPVTRRRKCQERLYKLFHNKYVNRVPVPVLPLEGKDPVLYVLDSNGGREVAKLRQIPYEHLSWRRRPKANRDDLDHDLRIRNMWVQVENLARRGCLEIHDLKVDRQLSARGVMKDKIPFVRQQNRVIRKEPDGFFKVLFPGFSVPASCFWEEDMGTMGQTKWQEKIRAYKHFRQSGLSEKFFETRHFRVLTRTTDPKRLQKLMDWSRQAGGDEFFWFTTQAETDLWHPTTLLDSIWQVIGHEGKYPLTLKRF